MNSSNAPRAAFPIGSLVLVKNNLLLGSRDTTTTMVCLGWLDVDHVIILHDEVVKKFTWEAGTIYTIGAYYEHDESYDVIEVVRPA